jgi:tetratricopeptide (TPR) repeat protein
VDRGVIATASELLAARHHPSVIALCSDALEDEPECVALLLLRARAHIALRRDLEAQADLRDVIRLDPRCGLAYRVLGELAARRDEHESAAIFFREALRLDPNDREASDWLLVVDSSARPAAAANKLPAPAAAAGRFSSPPRTRSSARSISAPVRSERLARGTQNPVDPELLDEPRTDRFARAELVATGTAQPDEPDTAPQKPKPAHAIALAIGSQPKLEPPPADRMFARSDSQPPVDVPVAKPPAIAPRPLPRGPMPELPGFGDYLVECGILTRERLRAAQAYQRSMKVQLSTAIVTLGLATPQRIEWAAVAHQAQLARARQP